MAHHHPVEGLQRQDPERARARESLSLSASLLAGAFVSTPFDIPSVCMALPFMIVNVALFIADLTAPLGAAEPDALLQRKLLVILGLFVVVQVGAAPVDAHRFIAGSVTSSFLTPADVTRIGDAESYRWNRPAR